MQKNFIYMRSSALLNQSKSPADLGNQLIGEMQHAVVNEHIYPGRETDEWMVFIDYDDVPATMALEHRPGGKELIAAVSSVDLVMTPSFVHLAHDCRSLQRALRVVKYGQIYTQLHGIRVNTTELHHYARMEEMAHAEKAATMLRARAAIGYSANGRVPYGMMVRGTRGARKLVPNKYERGVMETVARVFDECGQSATEAAQKLNLRLKYRGKRWTRRTVVSVLADAAALQLHSTPHTLTQPTEVTDYATDPTERDGDGLHGPVCDHGS